MAKGEPSKSGARVREMATEAALVFQTPISQTQSKPSAAARSRCVSARRARSWWPRRALSSRRITRAGSREGPVFRYKILHPMDTSMTIAIAVGVAIGLLLAVGRQGARNRELAARIEPLLRERGPQTLPELGEALGMGGFLARGKVAMALNDLVLAGKVEVLPAPVGTP